MTIDEVQSYKEKIKNNSCIIKTILKTMGGQCPDCLYSMLNSENVLCVLKDKELLLTAKAFFENDLSIIEASKSIFVHRNTLVYRLDKIKKLIGLDVRHFDDAMTFYVLLNLYENMC